MDIQSGLLRKKTESYSCYGSVVVRGFKTSPAKRAGMWHSKIRNVLALCVTTQNLARVANFLLPPHELLQRHLQQAKQASSVRGARGRVGDRQGWHQSQPATGAGRDHPPPLPQRSAHIALQQQLIPQPDMSTACHVISCVHAPAEPDMVVID
jgi:hypothetical protein